MAASTDGNTWQIYVDGEPFPGGTVDATLNPVQGAQMLLGQFYNAYWYKGRLAEVRIWDHVRTLAQVNWVGTSSMEIGVRVEAQPWGSASDEPLHVASAYVVFVAIDDDGRPRPVPTLVPENAEEERRLREAEIRRHHRLARKAEIESGRSAD